MATTQSQMPSAKRGLSAGAAIVLPLTEFNLAIHNKRVHPQELTHETIREWAETAKATHLYPVGQVADGLPCLLDGDKPIEENASEGFFEGIEGSTSLQSTTPASREPTWRVRPWAPNPDGSRNVVNKPLASEATRVEGSRTEQEDCGIQSEDHEASSDWVFLTTSPASGDTIILPNVTPKQKSGSDT
ncbi:hypothetical protein BJX68DRAFT_250540 [Aspergillus pseudodeflectus]|uniref:Uncharacterized protein n=1 Tax=Aspergillus pseudodeflectus TaxID=176178 RepID=A0ABR4J963_9EURO